MTVPKIHSGMGFRNLRQFNLVLLARQRWHLLKYPDSLVAKVLKACYFWDYDFFQANVDHNHSQIWRSICAARVILVQGCRKLVRDGLTINIWPDP
uniref:Uncharacterized protein n=1 Tax=Manihot esculenta TaxID=3983 RepID=A0A2C9UUI7_MANES